MKRTLNLTMPETWDQLTCKQLLFVCRMFLQQLTEHEFKLRVFIKLTGISTLPQKVIAEHVYYFFRKANTRFSLTVDELHWFIQSAAFLLNEVQLTVNHLPVIKFFGMRLHGPANKGYNITMLEYIHAEAAVYAWHKTKKPEHLLKLCAILYRPAKPAVKQRAIDFDGDKRQPFNDFTYQRCIKWFRLLPRAKVFAVYLFYMGFKNALVKAHPAVFSNAPVSSEPLNPTESLQQLVFGLNGGDITRNNDILRKPVWEIFKQLEYNAGINIAIARQMKQRK
jgi:hypothetical protein